MRKDGPCTQNVMYISMCGENSNCHKVSKKVRRVDIYIIFHLFHFEQSYRRNFLLWQESNTEQFP